MPIRPRSSAFRRSAATTGVVGAAMLMALAGGMTASAAPISCDTYGATTVAPGVCELRFTASTPNVPIPSGITQLEALLVSGGSAAPGTGYDSGAGGAVTYVNTVPTSGPLTIVIGTGGVLDGAGPTTTSLASGGSPVATADPASGSPAETTGILPSAFVASANAASVVFPAFAGEQYVAGDGQDGAFLGFGDPPPAGVDFLPAGGGTRDGFVNARPSSGGGGGGTDQQAEAPTTFNGGSGADGFVILRFAALDDGAVSPVAVSPAATSPALAATGVDPTAAVGAASALLLGGAAVVALTARTRRRSGRP